jgi:hypothetical protein
MFDGMNAGRPRPGAPKTSDPPKTSVYCCASRPGRVRPDEFELWEVRPCRLFYD